MHAEFIAVTVRYHKIVALDDVSVRLGAGVIGLLGENGAGKTTFLKVLSGALSPTTGSMNIRETRSGRGVALMPQTPEIIKALRTQEFVTYMTWLRGVNWSEANNRSREALMQVGLENRADLRLGELSGGMQRRVWLAQALAARPSLLLLDEPSTGLDPRQREVMVQTLARVSARSEVAIVLSSHILEDVAQLADRVLVLVDGRLSYDGQRPEVLDNRWFRRYSTGAREY